MTNKTAPRKIRKERNMLGIVGWVVSAVFGVYTIILLMPYIYAAFASISDYKDYYLKVFPFPEKGLKLKNYIDAWKNLKHEGNGVPEMIVATVIAPVVSAALDKAFGRMKIRQ